MKDLLRIFVIVVFLTFPLFSCATPSDKEQTLQATVQALQTQVAKQSSATPDVPLQPGSSPSSRAREAKPTVEVEATALSAAKLFQVTDLKRLVLQPSEVGAPLREVRDDNTSVLFQGQVTKFLIDDGAQSGYSVGYRDEPGFGSNAIFGIGVVSDAWLFATPTVADQGLESLFKILRDGLRGRIARDINLTDIGEKSFAFAIKDGPQEAFLALWRVKNALLILYVSDNEGKTIESDFRALAAKMYSHVNSNATAEAHPTFVFTIRAPDFTITTYDGMKISLSEMRGRPVIIHFWSLPPSDITPTSSCDTGLGILNQASQQYQDKGLAIIGIHVGGQFDPEERGKEYVKRCGISFPIGEDVEARIYHAFHLSSVLSATVFIDKDGSPLQGFDQRGERNGLLFSYLREEDLADRIKKLLGE